jgi:glycosyltransferase involved in cell wall biosynthesis
MKVLHVIPAVAPRYGGPSVSVPALCRALLAAGLDVTLLSTDADGPAELDVPLGEAIRYEGVRSLFFRRHLGDGFKYSAGLARWLRHHVAGFDLVHIHAVFSHSSLAAAGACRRAGVPYVVRPLGSLSPWGLRRKAVRKRMLQALAVRGMLDRAVALHFTSERERELAGPVTADRDSMVVPLGIDAGWLERPVAAGPDRDRTIVAMGRLHPVKNLELLVEAFAALERSGVTGGWRLVLCGDGDADYRTRLEAAGRGQVSFAGWLDDACKRDLLASAAIFAQPSHQENFGMAVLEALASEMPVVVTPAVGLAKDVAAASAGWVADPTVTAWTDVLGQAMVGTNERSVRGHRARRLAGRFSWPRVGAELAARYADLLQSNAAERSRPGHGGGRMARGVT